MSDIATTPLAERIARVLAAQNLSANADGEIRSAAIDVDIEWADRMEDAIAILKTLREPDRAMVDGGDAAIWEKMVSIAIAGGERSADSARDL